MRCLSCATDCPDDATFCGGCGRPLREAPGDERAFVAGDVIVGSYTVERALGEGGMGAVYLAVDRTSGQRVAVKVLPASLARERDIRERFIREARALAALDHPGIVPLITFAQDGDDRFLVMKYIAGEPLDVVIAREGVLEPARAHAILRSMADALAHAHDHGVVHRDVKPANVLLDESGRVVLVDFGIARTADGARRVTETGMLMGTPWYMSPEQIAGHPVDGRADLYACGLVLFEMLTGAPPFDDGSTFDILKSHVEAPVPDVDVRRAARVPGSAPVPDDLRALLAALLQKDPTRRPASGHDVVAILDGRAPPPTVSGAPGSRGPDEPPRSRPRTAAATPSLAFTDARDDDELEPLPAIRRPLWPVLLVTAAAAGMVGLFIVGTADDAPADVTRATDAGPAGDTRFEEAVLVARARVALDKGRVDDARIAVETAQHLGLASPALQLTRAELALAAGRRDDAIAIVDSLGAVVLDEETGARLARLRPRLATTTTTPPPPSPTPVPRVRPAPPPTTTTTEPTTTTAPSPVDERPRPNHLDDDALAAVTGATRESISACYAEHILAKHVDADDGDAPGGTVEVAVLVRPAGTVASSKIVRSSFKDAGLEGCVKDVVRAWRFPPFSGGEDTLVHTFTFRPRR